MRVIVLGGTGYIGSCVIPILLKAGHEVTILSRSANSATYPSPVKFITGDPLTSGAWQAEVRGQDAVINLAGAPIFSRWNRRTKKNILLSRLLTTQHVVEALDRERQVRVSLLNASAVGYYGWHGEEELDERSLPGDDFLATVCKKWEKAAREAQAKGIRVLLCRFGIVLGINGGALKKMLPLFRTGLGSRIGSGQQGFSWIHEQDLARAMLHLLETEELDGPFNLTAPLPVNNARLTQALHQVLGKRGWLPPIPLWSLRVPWGEFADSLAHGQRVVPERLLRSGFEFRYPEIETALAALLGS